MIRWMLIALTLGSGACVFDSTGLPAGDGDGGAGGDGAPGDASGVDAGQTNALNAGDARLIFAEQGAVSLSGARWRSADDAWTDDAATPPVAGGMRWMANAVSPAGDELAFVMAEAGQGSELRAMHRTNSMWLTDWVLTHPGVPATSKAFDAAFTASGSLLVVYSDGTPTPSYRTWSGGQWSVPQVMPINDGGGPNPDPNGGAVRWVELDAHPSSGAVALAYADANHDLIAAVWSGTEWIEKSVFTAETDLKRNGLTADVANRAFDVAFEADSGDAVLAWGRNAVASFYYSVYDDNSHMWRMPDYQANVIPGQTHFLDLESDPATNRIALVLLDLGEGTERLALGMWNGAAWGEASELDSQIRDVNDAVAGDVPAAVAWRGDRAVAIFPDNEQEVLDWALWTAIDGWVVQLDAPVPNKGFTESVYLVPAGADSLVAAISDHNGALYGASYDGQGWSVTGLTEAVGSLTSAPFSIAARAP